MSMQGIEQPCLAEVDEDDHFALNGLCQCGCAECTTRLAGFCVCMDCPCESQEDHAHWIRDDTGARRGGVA